MAEAILTAIRTNYLQARAPQQIQELANLFHSVNVSVTATNQADLQVTLGGSVESNQTYSAKVQGDLDKVGIMTEKENLCLTEMGGNAFKEVTPGSKWIPTEDMMLALQNLCSVTVGFSPEARIREIESGGEDESNFLHHPPVQYRIAFAKHVIKQMESTGKRSAPQGGRQQDIEYPVEQEALILENWYDTLEQLSSSGQVLSEPFYRLYEIKLPANHNKKERQQEIVKIFENENSFVADGTTGLVTWKAAIEFTKWMSSKETEKELTEVPKAKQDGNGAGTLLHSCKWILELGCGCGFLAVAVTKYLHTGLEQYIATDGSLAALERARENVDTNFSLRGKEKAMRLKIRFERVDWQNDRTKEAFTQLVDGMTSIYGPDHGILLGTDIIFDPEMIPDLVELINDFVEKRAGSALISCTIRNPETMQAFKNELGKDARDLVVNVCGKWEDGEILFITHID